MVRVEAKMIQTDCPLPVHNRQHFRYADCNQFGLAFERPL